MVEFFEKKNFQGVVPFSEPLPHGENTIPYFLKLVSSSVFSACGSGTEYGTTPRNCSNRKNSDIVRFSIRNEAECVLNMLFDLV